MDQVKKIIESQYTGLCTVIEYQSIKDPITFKTTHNEVPVLTDIPCRLSFKAISKSNENEINNQVTQQVKLFLNSSHIIKTGSKIIVNQNSRQFTYKNSSEPAIYPTHQEIVLEPFKGWT